MNQDTSKMAIAEPEALQLARELDTKAQALGCPLDRFSAVLRLQHTRIAELEAENKQLRILASGGIDLFERYSTFKAKCEELEAMLDAVGAGGVGQSIKPQIRADASPIAWAVFTRHGTCRMWSIQKDIAKTAADDLGLPLVPLYAAPQPARQPLTDEQIALISVECAASHKHDDIHFARAIEESVANQPPSQPLTDSQVKELVKKRPAEDLCRWSYGMGIKDAEAAHGINGSQQ